MRSPDMRASGTEIRAVPLTKRYAHDLDAMIGRTDASTGLIYVCNPNNPTGGLTPKGDFESFFARVPKGASVLIDEAYHDFVPPTSTYTTWVGRAASDPRLHRYAHALEGVWHGGTSGWVRGGFN
jgi:histidinol-phosphate/aromatic aminotransferase/cobyric acid decarboxylase-like protein